MTSKERIAQLIVAKEPADRVGLYDHYWPETRRDYWVNEGYGDADLSPTEFFGYDIVAMWPVPDPGPLKGRDGVVEESDEWQVFRNGYGATQKLWKHKSGTPEHLDFTIKTRQDWDRVKPSLLAVDPSRTNLADARKLLAGAAASDRFSCFGFLFLIELMRAMIGDLVMLPSLLLEPDWIHDICRTYTDFFKKHMAYVMDEVGRPDGVWIYEDLGFTNGLFASPKTIRELLLPYYKEMVSFLKDDYGVAALIHTCGDIREAVPIIIEAGWDCLQPMEAKAGVDVLELADTFGNRLAYMGNINVVKLETNDRDVVRGEVMHKMGGMIERRMPYILHSDHSLPPDIRMATYQYMLQLHREHGDYR
jgi:uroporphyrinogen decarboxylase